MNRIIYDILPIILNHIVDGKTWRRIAFSD